MLYISCLKANFVRNLADLNIEPGRQINYFYGPNASGKTSILETIFLLSRVKSFRTNRINSVIKHGEKTLSVFAQGTKNNQAFNVGIEKGRAVMRLKVNGASVQSASEQAKSLPVFLLAPDHNLLFYGGPKQRRHWLDWSLFHVKHNYLDTWKNYHRAVRHRNALLKAHRDITISEVKGWEKLMAEESEKIDSLRQGYLQQLNQLMNDKYLPAVLPGSSSMDYRLSCSGTALLEMLEQKRSEDQHRGYTGYGPHRADICFDYGELDVARHLSRGQIKLFGAALISAQLEVINSNGQGAIVLVDDIDAELDIESSRKIMRLLVKNNAQTFVSSLALPDWVPNEPGVHAVFHVEHGAVQKV